VGQREAGRNSRARGFNRAYPSGFRVAERNSAAIADTDVETKAA